MPTFSKKNSLTSTDDLVQQINTLLGELGADKNGNERPNQGGGNRDLVAEVNNLLSEIRGTATNLSEAEVMNLAMKGGARKGRKGKGKSKSKKSKSKANKNKKSRSKKTKKSKKSKKSKRSMSRVKAKKAKGKTKSKSKSKSNSSSRKNKKAKRGKTKSRSQSRGTGNTFIADLTTLKKYIKEKLPNEELNHIVMSTPASKLLKDNERDVEKAKKAFNASSFMRDYKAAKKASEDKKAAKKERA